ncbi:MAG TPA: phage holin family protein [Chthoniobacterales bacterium]
MAAFLVRWLITAFAVMVASFLLRGISYSDSLAVLLGASLLLGIINALIRPVLLILSLPFILVTMGIFIFVINALLLLLVSKMIPGFQVDGFWSAFFGSIIISIVSWLLSAFFRGSDGKVYSITHHGRLKRANARVVGE